MSEPVEKKKKSRFKKLISAARVPSFSTGRTGKKSAAVPPPPPEAVPPPVVVPPPPPPPIAVAAPAEEPAEALAAAPVLVHGVPRVPSDAHLSVQRIDFGDGSHITAQLVR